MFKHVLKHVFLFCLNKPHDSSTTCGITTTNNTASRRAEFRPKGETAECCTQHAPKRTDGRTGVCHRDATHPAPTPSPVPPASAHAPNLHPLYSAARITPREKRAPTYTYTPRLARPRRQTATVPLPAKSAHRAALTPPTACSPSRCRYTARPPGLAAPPPQGTQSYSRTTRNSPYGKFCRAP